MTAFQTGIFALGDAAHVYLEFHLDGGVAFERLVRSVASLHEPRTTVGGVNLVVGFRPSRWRELAPQHAPSGAADFDAPLAGPDGFTMPATQSDAWIWIAGASYDVVWDTARAAVDALRGVATLEREISGWSYRHSRDLTGFEDGTENPTLMEAPGVAIAGEGPGAGASIVLLQQWRHERTWSQLSVDVQEAAMGRTKDDSIEFSDEQMPADAHVARAKDVVDGEERKIFRRNVPYGNVQDHGTVFVGFSAEQSRLARMLERMAGIEDGIRDALTRYTTPLTGAYYVVPSLAALQAYAEEPTG